MQKPKPGIAKRPRDLEIFLCSMVDEINAIRKIQAEETTTTDPYNSDPYEEYKIEPEPETTKADPEPEGDSELESELQADQKPVINEIVTGPTDVQPAVTDVGQQV